ncbi:hypothetical protein FOCC_FOCC013509 [Frankliniella occidentalis]|nr:hypothetical protein FOCC_FOCC013509 [Frankliniella occidentalis]
MLFNDSYYYNNFFAVSRSPHVHMLLWLEGAPKFNVNDPHTYIDVITFIDKIISCSSENLEEDLVKLQTHKHSHTCKRKNGNSDDCRFGIPYFPMKTTRILSPLPNDVEVRVLAKYKRILQKIKNILNEPKTTLLSYEDFLNALHLTEKRYLKVIRSTLRTHQVFIKRKPKDTFISPYSRKILTLMRSNMNLQFVLDAYGAACYIIDYINKSCRGMSKIMRNVLKEIREGNENLQQSLRKISNTFHNNSELSIQEAVYNILQLPLSKSSEECIFIPTFPPQERVHLVKSQSELEMLDETSTDIYEHGLLEHYVHRPHSLEDLSLADFAANYRYASKCGPNSIPLLNNNGHIFLRRQPRVIRFRNYHYEIDSENFLREQVMLYVPWRNEERDIINQDLETQFHNNKEQIRTIRKKYSTFDDKALFDALEVAMERTESDEEAFDKGTRPTFDFDDFSLQDEYNFADIQREFEEDYSSHVSFTSPVKMPNKDYQDLVTKLNQEQRNYVMHVVDTLEKTEEQVLHFLTGGAGVGKSLVISTLYQTLFRLFNADPNTNPDDPKVLLCAPTGKASFNIGGQTIHSLFKLPLNQKNLNQLSPSVSNTLSTKLRELKVLIIDEISMVGQHILDMIDQRLRHLLQSKLPFGGVSIIAVGDFHQLRPVAARALFYPEASNPYQEIFSEKLWPKFKVYELKCIMRQSNKKFQTALNHLAKGKLQKEDIALFSSRCFKTVPKKEDLSDAYHLFARNDDVDNYNNHIMNKLKGKLITCEASDVIRGNGSQLAQRQILYTLNTKKTNQTMGIPKSLPLKISGKYMMTYNVNTEDGLCNGATGTLMRIDQGKNNDGDKKPLRLWIKFDDPKVGSLLRKKFHSKMRNLQIPDDWTPIEPITVTIQTKKNSTLKVNRKQFPLVVAHAFTIHKSQGQTLQKVVLHIKGRMSRELLYVGCSRATSLNGLYIIGSFPIPKRLEKTSHLGHEIKSWKRRTLLPKYSFLCDRSKNLQIVYHNVQSLTKHINLVRNDDVFMNSDLLIFGETWTLHKDVNDLENFTLLAKTDSGLIRKPRGISVYARKNLLNSIISCDAYTIKDTKACIDFAVVKMTNLTVIGIYASPKCAITHWHKFFKRVQNVLQTKCIIVGDFNINHMKMKRRNFMNIFLQKFNLHLKNTSIATTHSNTAIDWILSNTSKLKCGTYNSLFSHHYPLWITKKYEN